MSGLPDVVYVLKSGTDHLPELRYSLRSIAANLPHGRVFMAGHCPTWARNVTHIYNLQGGQNRYRNSAANLRAALRSGLLGPRFYLFNDDFFAMTYGARPPVAHRGTMTEQLGVGFARQPGGTDYLTAVDQTRRWLEDKRGVTEPLSYELHLPMPMETATARDIIDAIPDEDFNSGLVVRSIVGNLSGMGGTRMDDVRPARDGYWDWDWLSTNDHSFRAKVGDYITARFPTPSRYEDHAGAPRETNRAWVNLRNGLVRKRPPHHPECKTLDKSPDWRAI